MVRKRVMRFHRNPSLSNQTIVKRAWLDPKSPSWTSGSARVYTLQRPFGTFPQVPVSIPIRPPSGPTGGEEKSLAFHRAEE